ncbi:alpha/beta hydrolase [Actinoplanes sp. NBRC 103695]|uniref:alpha/beta fold hydrolase n=1 Tax=Actinoplanes sp. NBRC 103695 TaxID=3032202 RepID=UPI002552163A|nr:alpha/beta hydrolase [Actinoplanes sp. NBRC 103695]
MPERSEVTLPDGVRLFVETSGPAEAPVTVILLHGWCLDRRIWHHQVQALGDVRVVAYDARGHGRSSATLLESATLPQLGADLAEVIRVAAPEGPIVLVGHSLGGMTIMEYAAEHPEDFTDRVAGLALISTTAEGHTHTRYGLPGQLSTLLRYGETIGAGVLARCGAWRPHQAMLPVLRPSVRWLLFGEECDDAALTVTMRAVGRATLRSIGGFRPTIGAQQRLETLAAWNGVPSAVLVGDRDRLTPPACAESIAAHLPGAELSVLPDAGHMLMLERPEAVTATLRDVICRATGTMPIERGRAGRRSPAPTDLDAAA